MRILTAVATLLLISPAMAADKPAKPPKPAKEKLQCRTTALTGSRLSGGERTCKTAQQWEADRATQQRDLEKRARDN